MTIIKVQGSRLTHRTSVIADSPIERYKGMTLESDNRLADLRSVCALMALIDQIVTGSECAKQPLLADHGYAGRSR